MAESQSEYAKAFDSAMESLETYRNGAQKFTLKGESVYITKKVLHEHVLVAIEKLASLASLSQADEVVRLRTAFEDETKKVLNLQAAIEIAKKNASELSKVHDQERKEFDEKFKGFKEYEAHSVQTIKDKEAVIASHKAAADHFAKQLKASEAKWDPETARHVEQQRTAENEGKIAVEKELASLKAELHAARAEIDTSRKALNKHVDANNAAMTELHGLRNLDDLIKCNVPIKPREVVNDSTLVRIFLGDHSLTWLQKLDEVNRANMRDRAYHLLQVVKHSENKKVSALKVLIQSVLDWIKDKKNRVALILEAWLTEIENDLKNMSLKSLKAYRESLEALKTKVDKVKKEVKASNKKAKYTGNFIHRVVSSLSTAVKSVATEFNLYKVGSVIRRKFSSSVRTIARVPGAIGKWLARKQEEMTNRNITTVGDTYFSHTTDNVNLRRVLAANKICWLAPNPYVIALVRDDLHACGWSSWSEMIKYVEKHGNHHCPADAGEDEVLFEA